MLRHDVDPWPDAWPPAGGCNMGGRGGPGYLVTADDFCCWQGII